MTQSHTHRSTKQLATALNVTPPRISQLVTSGVLPAPIDGRHDPFVAVPRYLELKQRRGELVAREAIEKEWLRVARTTRDNLFNVPDRVAAQCASMREQSNVHALLTTEIRQCLESLAGEIVRPAASPRQ